MLRDNKQQNTVLNFSPISVETFIVKGNYYWKQNTCMLFRIRKLQPFFHVIRLPIQKAYLHYPNSCTTLQMDSFQLNNNSIILIRHASRNAM